MSNKAVLLAFSLIALSALMVVPMADVSADDDIMTITSDPDTSVSDSGSDREYLYEGVMIVLVVLGFLGILHIFYHSKKK